MSLDSKSIESQFNVSSANSNRELVYEFDDFRLEPGHLMLYQRGRELEFAPKVVETLLALLEKSGAIVSKEDMRSRVWKGEHVDDSNLTQNIYLLRKTLGSTADGRPLIETFRRRGYRFNGKVNRLLKRSPAAAIVPGDVRPDGTVFDSLAVLPFKNESADPNADYLSDGITESIINRLSHLNHLRVAARGTSFRYKGLDVAPQKIGRDLGVSAVLTGRVLQHGESLIVRTELAETENGWQLWGEQYDSRASDILALQETIAKEISRNLQLKFTGDDQRHFTRRFTESTEAYHLYIKGRYDLHKRLTESIERAAEYFERAIDVDPSYALAYIGLADSYPLLSLYGELTPAQAYPKAKAAASKALELDDRLTTAYNALGVIKFFYEWDWKGAESAFLSAIELNPGYADAHQRYGMFMTAVERFEEGEFELQRAQELDPLSLITKTISGYPYYYSRQYERAAERFREVIMMDPGYSMAHFRLGLTYAQQGKFKNALAELQRSAELSNDRDTIAALGYVHGLTGNAEASDAALAELSKREEASFVSAYDHVLVYTGMNEDEAALDWLEKAFEERSYWLIYLKVDPALDRLRNHPRFAAVLKRVFDPNS